MAQNLAIGVANGSADDGLTKLGSGTLTLTGTSTYLGDTNVTAGTLAITGGSVGVANAAGRLVSSQRHRPAKTGGG